MPEDGFAQTINYEFQAEIHDDESGTCRRLVVHVDVVRFLADYSRLEDELVGWLWREGVT